MEADIVATMVVVAAVAAEATTITTEVVEEEAIVVVEVTEAAVVAVDIVSTEEEVEAIEDTTATVVVEEVVVMAIDILQGHSSSRNSLMNLTKKITNSNSHLKSHSIDPVVKLPLLNLSSKKVMAEIWLIGTNMLKKNSQMKNKWRLSGHVLQTAVFLRSDISSSMYSKKKSRKEVRKAKRKIAHLM